MKKTITLVSQNRTVLHSLTKTFFSPGSIKMFFLNELSLLKNTLPAFVFIVTHTFFSTSLNANNGTCVLACDQSVNVSLPNACEAEIEYDMILEGIGPHNCSPYFPGAFEVTVMTSNGVPIPTSPVVTAEYIGQTLSVKVEHGPSGNSCWGNINVEDKLAPVLVCPSDLTVACTADTSPAATGEASATDCSEFTIVHFDNTVINGCNGNFSGVLTRTWTATDEHGNFASCLQTVNIAQPANNDVTWPPHRDGISGPALDCANPDIDPSNTGVPTIAGEPIPNGSGFCSMAVDYSDQILPLCENAFKILRNWTVVSWCTGAVLNHTQIIAVKDTSAPNITCPPSLSVGTTSSIQCKATVILPGATITDDCSSNFNVTMHTPAGFITGNGGVIHDVNVGNYNLTYTVTDDCGNTSSCATTLSVSDDDAPTVICDEFTVTTLNSNGLAVVFATTFDDGTYDNCGPVVLSARRMTAMCGEQPVFGPTVTFCCEDVGEAIAVEMQATDLSGNSNSCMVTVHVDDNSDPAILCPPNVTLNCQQDPGDLSLTGEPTVYLACGTADVTFSDIENLNLCDVGFITRTWTATSGNGNSNSCSQTITLIDDTPVVIEWPEDYDAMGCVDISDLSPDSLPAPYNYPVVTEDCELIATNVSDQVFTVAAPACFKIVRTWTLIDWCTYQAGGSTGIWTHNQIIKVTDVDAPVFTCPDNLVVGVGNDCKAAVTLPDVTDIVDCSEDITVFVNSDFGVGPGPFQQIDPGTYEATYVVSDGCNNSSNCTISIEVKDVKKPTPYCKNGIITELMGVDTNGDGVIDDGMIVALASSFDDGSFDNCPGNLKFSFSPDIQVTTDTFDCTNVGQVPLEIWVTDVAGNQDFCENFIVIQDNMGVCSGNLFANVGGAIINETGNSVQNVMVNLNHPNTPPAMTGSDGNFQFSALPLGNDFTVTPEKDTNLLNGVTTFDIVLIRKHILATDTLDSPYKMIAADVNRSNSITTADMVAVRRAILFLTDAFPNNESWRFIDAAYQFPNQQNPFQDPFPEIYNINNFNGNMDEVDFIAVKIGDVNGSATPNLFAPAGDDRSGGLLTMSALDQPLMAGQTYHLEVTSEKFLDILGYQFTIDFDHYALEYIRVEKGVLPSLTETNFGFALLEQGAITTSWNSHQPASLLEGESLFSLVFRAKTNTTWADALQFGSAYTPAEAYHSDGTYLDVELAFVEAPMNIPAPSVAYPNPFAETTVIGFTSEIGGEVILTVFGPSGRVVETVRQSVAPGAGQVEIHADRLEGRGTYFYQLQLENRVETGKVVLMK